MAELIPDGEENNVGKGENAGFQHFSLSHIVFRRLLFQGRQNPGLFCKFVKLPTWLRTRGKHPHVVVCTRYNIHKVRGQVHTLVQADKSHLRNSHNGGRGPSQRK